MLDLIESRLFARQGAGAGPSSSLRVGTLQFFRVAAFPVLALLLLTGCVHLSRPALVRQNFSFPVPPVPASAQVTNGPVLGIRRLSIAAPFDTQSLTYRTGEFSYEQDPYAQFLVSPGQSLAESVRAWFRRAGIFSDVTEPGSPLQPNLLADITVEQLYGDFGNRAKPAAVLGMRFTFYQSSEGLPGKVFMEKYYSRRVPLAAHTAAAVMAAWNEALKEIMEQVTSDLKSAGI